MTPTDTIPQIGATLTVSKAISDADVALFTLVANDQPEPTEEPTPMRPPMLDPPPPAPVPGALVAAFLAATAARHLGGLAAAQLLRAEVTASATASTDDTLTATAQVAAFDPAARTLRVTTHCVNQNGVRLAEGIFDLRAGG